MNKFTININIDNEQSDIQQVEQVSTVLRGLRKDLNRWRALILSRRLLNKQGEVIGWVGMEDEDDWKSLEMNDID